MQDDKKQGDQNLLDDPNWQCLYIASGSSTVAVTLDSTPYSDTADNLVLNYPSIFQIGESPNQQDTAIMFINSGSGHVSGTVDSIAQVSTTCDFIGGHPKPPNR